MSRGEGVFSCFRLVGSYHHGLDATHLEPCRLSEAMRGSYSPAGFWF